MRYTSYKTVLLTVLIGLFSCTDEGVTPGPGGEKNVNEWIYDTMVDHYLWYKDIESINPVYSLDAQSFFYSLLSEEDGKTSHYSYISPKTKTKAYMGDEDSFGFEYQAYYKDSKLEEVALQVLYVLPASSAAEKGLKRGDWIIKVNGSNLYEETYYSIINNSTILSLLVANSANATTGEGITLNKGKVVDDPVFVSKRLRNNIGYIMYNHFTTGPNGTSDLTFDNSLREAFQSMKGVQDMILDLRYNNGGYVSCAQLLASFLVPKSNINDVFCLMTYNDKHSKNNYTYPFRTSEADNNLNLNRLFVITSYHTASASELVIASLIPYFGKDKVHIISTSNNHKATTEGKNVGSTEYEDDKYDWILHPIVCHVTNKDELDYSEGFEPTNGFALEEKDGNSLGELGDENEKILKSVLKFIESGKLPSTYSNTKSTNADLIPLKSSLYYKQSKGLKL